MEPDPSPRSHDQDKKDNNAAVHSIEDDAQRLLNALISPELGAFDRFSIQPHSEDYCDIQLESKSSPHVGKRIKKETELTKQRRQELEEVLYGGMKSEANKIQATQQQVKFEQMEDEEIRLNASALQYVRERRNTDRKHIDCQRISPSVSFAQQIILVRLSCADSHTRLKSRPEPTEAHSANRRFGNEHDLSLNQIYILRYLPTFLLRAAWRDDTVDVDRLLHSEMFKLLLSNFCDTEFIRKRLSAFGIFNGVLVHIEEADSILAAFRQRSLDGESWQEYYRKIHTSLIRCLESLMESQMRCAGFVKLESDNVPSAGWQGDYDAMSGNGIDFMRVASSCLEISRALHFVGTNLGSYEQSILASSVGTEGNMHHISLPFDAVSTSIEIKAYGGAKDGYQAALHLLRSAEKKGRNEIKRRASFPEATSTSIEGIYVARSSVELYLADTMTTLAYCLEEKQRDHPRAIEAYQEALAFYSKHAGKKNSTVIHSLQSVGIIHMEQKQWREARKVLEEAFDLMKKSVQSCSNVRPAPVDPTEGQIDNSLSGTNSFSDEDLAGLQRSIGICMMELEDYAKAAEAFCSSIESFQMHLRCAPVDRDLDPIDDFDDPMPLSDQKMQSHPFICDVLSKSAEAHYLISVDASRRLLRHQFRKIFSDEAEPEASIEALCFSRLQAEQKSLVVTEEVIKMRQCLLETETDGQNPLAGFRNPSERVQQQDIPLPSDKAFCYAMALDLIRIGTLYFHLQRYSDACSSWHDSTRLLGDIKRRGDDGTNDDIIRWICKVTFFVGIANMRNTLPEEALRYFNACLKILGEFHTHPGADSDSVNLDIARCEHAIGTALNLDKKGALAESHLLNALRIFRAVSKRRKANASTNCAIAAVMASLGRLDHEADRFDRSLGFLKGAAHIYSSVGKKIAKLGTPSIKSECGLSGTTLGQLILATGNAHRCLAHVQKDISDKASRTSFETAVLVLDSYSSVSELKVQFDEEADFEFLGVSFHSETSLICYKQLLDFIQDKPVSLQGASEECRDVHLTEEDLLFRMGNVYARCGESSSALRCFIKAKELTEARLGTSHHSIVVNILFNMGCVHQNILALSGENLDVSKQADARKKAIWAFRESLRISKLLPCGPNAGQEETCTRLACLLMVNEEFEISHLECEADDESATHYLLESIALRRSRGDEQSLESAESLYRLGIIALRRWDGPKSALEAEKQLRKSLDIRLAILGDHVDVAKTHYALAIAMWKSFVPKNDENAENSCLVAMQHLNEAFRIQKVFYELGKHDQGADQWQLLLVLVKILFAVGSIFEFQCEERRAIARYFAALELLEVYETEYTTHSDNTEGNHRSIRREWQAKLVYNLSYCRIKCGLYEESIEGKTRH
jgi:tetratricopeptide (TPR) repeat protein